MTSAVAGGEPVNGGDVAGVGSAASRRGRSPLSSYLAPPKASLRAKIVAPLAGVAFLIGLWELVVVAGQVPSYVLPGPGPVAVSLVQNSALIWSEAWVTIQESALGFLIAVAVSAALAVAIVQLQTLRLAIYPIVVSSQVVPKVAIAPVFVIWLGYGIVPKLFDVALVSFFPIVINSIAGLASLDQEYIRLAAMMQATRRSLFFRFQLPNAMPFIFAGLKVGISLAVIGAIVGELAGTDSGIGYIIEIASGKLDMSLAFAGIIAATVAAAALFLIVVALERVFTRWQ